jgi:hypothetical protein
MAQPVYKMWMFRYKEAWYKLSKAEQDKNEADLAAALKQVGGERLMVRVCLWSSEQWVAWGVEKFPSIEAEQQFTMLLFGMNHYRYMEAVSYLGTEMA